MLAIKFRTFVGLYERSTANFANDRVDASGRRGWDLPTRPGPRSGRHNNPRDFVVRVAVLLALILIPFWGIFRGVVLSIAAGAPIAYLTVVPLLIAMIGLGHRRPPNGVGDAEADWILAGFFGGLGLFLRHLMSNRFPTLSGLWQLPLVGAVLWAACAAAVLFGVRRVMQTWPLWVFAVATVTPLPYLLVTAAAGGGAVAAAAVTGVIGGVAVFLAAPDRPPVWRLGVAATTSLVGVGAAVIAVGGGLDGTRSSLLLVVLCGGVFPVFGFLLLHGIGSRASQSAGKAVLPRRSWGSLAVLGLGAGIVLLLNQPYTAFDGQPASAQANWAARLGLPAGEQFSFIQRYLGPHATFARHAVPSIPGLPEAAVDVITTNNLAALRTYRDALWYPATVPPNYQPLELGDPAVVEGRAAATDSSLATDPHVPDWYVVTWLWRTDAAYQQIFVVVNQTWTSKAAPPVPVPLSIRATVIGPALWLVRQQADPGTKVDPAVTARAQQVVRRVLSAGGPGHG